MNAGQDARTLTARVLKHNLRSPDTIVTTLVTPVMILLAFVFVLGGAMDTGEVRYVDFVMPVVLLFAMVSGVSYTAWRVNQDVASGIQARFRTMPIARWAITGGHILASILTNAVSVAALFGIALVAGYRPQAGPAGWAATIALVLAALVAFATMGTAFGFLAKTNEGAGMFAYVAMALLFVSSGFAPTSTMPAGLRAFADHQPMTPIIDAIRDAQLGAGSATTTLIALAWLTAITILFAALATLGGKRRA
ncbi:MAG: ABC transporter permease, partial [Bifidobacteriaceae bacterium]|nr:ABC transporter permease [Bifidobacteriaceae bacterium]